MWENYMERVGKLLKSIDGYADIRLEHRASLTINMKNGIIENFNRILDMGGCVRVLLKNHGWGIATLNDLNNIDKAFTDAVYASRVLIPDEPIKIFEMNPLRATIAIETEDPFENHSNEEKIDLVTQYNEIMRESGGNPLVLATTVYGEIRSTKLFMNTFGVIVDHD
jgi:predicted Zn-dependent protease